MSRSHSQSIASKAELSQSRFPRLPSRSFVSAIRKATNKKEQLIGEVVVSLLRHRGPDDQGRAHPVQKRIHFKILESAIHEARKLGLLGNWRPYHFQGHYGTYTQPAYVNEVILEKGNEILRQKAGSFRRFLSEIRIEDWETPLRTYEDGRLIEVKMSGITSEQFDRHVYSLVKRYLTLSGHQVLADKLRPWHLSTASMGTYEQPELVRELLLAAGENLLAKKGGDLGRFISQTTSRDWMCPFRVTLEGVPLEIHALTLVRKYSGSNSELVKDFLRFSGHAELAAQLKPWHFGCAPNGTFSDAHLSNELLLEKGNQLLARKKGDRQRFRAETTLEEWEEELQVCLSGCVLQVSVATLAGKYSRSRTALAAAYLSLVDSK